MLFRSPSPLSGPRPLKTSSQVSRDFVCELLTHDTRAPHTSTAASAPVESTVEMVARKSPPGLVRVAARFEAMGAEGRTGGQSNALAQISRNLQRYVETQSLETPPAPLPDTPVVPPAVVDAEAPVELADPVLP